MDESKQKIVYAKFISPHFDKSRETEECPFEIEIYFIGDAIRAEASGNPAICQHCLYVGELSSRDN
jgi:hypothetical protein